MFPEIRMVVTFPNTTAAMAFKDYCETNDVPGRLVPIPQSLHAGCGQAWSAPLSARKQLEGATSAPGIRYSEVTLVEQEAEH